VVICVNIYSKRTGDICTIGRVKKYFSEKGFGFIESEGTDYFFHVSEIKQGGQLIEPGFQVEFDVISKPRGLTATNIRVKETHKATFLKFGDTRIKTTNIKQYGIDTERVRKQEWQKATFGKVLGVIFEGGTISTKGNVLVNNYMDVKVLYVTTYQGDNYRFREDQVDFDIDEKLREIDELLVN